MRKARVFFKNNLSGILEEISSAQYRFIYEENYRGEPISLTMPIQKKQYEFDQFPAFFDGLLPEGLLLEAMLHKYKIDKDDYFSQLIQIGKNLVGAVTVEEITDH